MEIIGVILILFFYFLPTIIGWNKRNSGAILMLNLLLGWTVIGWIVSLIWSLTNDAPTQQIIYVEKEKSKQESEKKVKRKKDIEEKTYTKEELQRMLDNMKD